MVNNMIDVREAPVRTSSLQMAKAILSDVQFWVPCVVLAGGILLLGILH